MTEPQTLLIQANRLPPPLCRLLCSLTEKEIAAKSGLSVMTIRRISAQPTWRQVKTVSAFLQACGIEVKLTIPALRRVNKIMANKNGLEGIRNLKGQKKTKAIRRLIKALHV